jgi:hypothetical protein
MVAYEPSLTWRNQAGDGRAEEKKKIQEGDEENLVP